MAHRADDIRQDTADAQQNIENTRSAMTEKLEILKERARETGEGAQSSVEEIVENVKETVGDTVETEKRTLDLHYQVDQHPWLMFGGSLLVGYPLGSWGGDRTSSAFSTTDTRLSPVSTTADISASYARPGSLTAYRESSARPPLQQGMGSGVLDQFKDEIALIEGAVIGAVISTLGDMVKQALLPPPAPHSTSARTKLGGQPSESPEQTPASPFSTAVNVDAVFSSWLVIKPQHAQLGERGVRVRIHST